MKLVKEAGCILYDITADNIDINDLSKDKNIKVLKDIANRINKYILNTLDNDPVRFFEYVDNFIETYSKDVEYSDPCPQCGDIIVTSKIEI